jgi:transcriptional regulator GlxA family with amidase domain
MIFIIEKYFGRETAIWCSKTSEIEIDRKEQSPLMIFNCQKLHSDKAILKTQQYIENFYNQKLNNLEIAEIVHMNVRSFLRRFKKATHNTPLEYMLRVRIEVAKKRLESTNETVLEVMYHIGYKDEKTFRKTFKKYTGISLKKYRNKYYSKMTIA